MTMLLRRAMMRQDNSILPEGYQRIDYLESSATQYIDTGVTFNQGIKITAKMSFVSYGNGQTLFGARLDTGATRFLVTYYTGLDFGYGGDHVLPNYTVESNKIIDIIHDTTERDYFTYGVPNNTYRLGRSTLNTNTTGYIFAYHRANDDSIQGWSSARFYSMLIKDSTQRRLFDGIPCVRIADNTPGIYDFANQRFLTNAGSGSFIIPT